MRRQAIRVKTKVLSSCGTLKAFSSGGVRCFFLAATSHRVWGPPNGCVHATCRLKANERLKMIHMSSPMTNSLEVDRHVADMLIEMDCYCEGRG